MVTSDLATYITGQTIGVDGGLSLAEPIPAQRPQDHSRRPDELRNAMLDEFPHHQTCRRPPDAINVEDPTRDSIEVIGIPRHDVHEQVGHARQTVHLDDLGHVGERH